ncbi:MAG: chemotaxis protein CheW [Bacteroidota bacterium]|nr:chemotaxis protein CheW [Bacteroidota bacterium]
MLDIQSELLADKGQDEQKNQYLIFRLEDDQFGIEIEKVTEIVGIQKITQVPEMPNYIKGIINLRGKIIPVMDVRMRFKKDAIEYNDRTCVVIVEMQNISVGLIVDDVCDVASLGDEDIVPPPDMGKNENRFIKGIGKAGQDVKLILDCERLLSDDEVENLIQIH